VLTVVPASRGRRKQSALLMSKCLAVALWRNCDTFLGHAGNSRRTSPSRASNSWTPQEIQLDARGRGD
jgi:hypothetical protein